MTIKNIRCVYVDVGLQNVSMTLRLTRSAFRLVKKTRYRYFDERIKYESMEMYNTDRDKRPLRGTIIRIKRMLRAAAVF